MDSKQNKTVLVTGIGGNVGQGILRNIIKTNFNIKRIGCNVTSFSAGNHLCDSFYKVPYAMESNYIDTINDIIEKEKVDLIIPSTDYEIYYLSKNQHKVNCNIIVSSLQTTKTYLDKYLTFLHHKKHHLPFATSYLPKDYIAGTFSNYIVKPREGRGSRDIHINPSDLSVYDDSYIVQELIEGKEITTAFYVNKENKLHGFINLERKLENGTTNECFVNRNYDDQLEKIIKKIISYNEFSGGINLQSIVTEDNRIIPFEINCRISGTNSIRSNFGFEDVKYSLEEHLYQKKPSSPIITNGSAVRILMDVIYPSTTETEEKENNKSNFFIF